MPVPVFRLAVILSLTGALTACGLLQRQPAPVPFDAEGVVALDGVEYAYAFDPEGSPMAPTVMEGSDSGTIVERLMPAAEDSMAPVLRIGFADGREMTQEDRNGSRQVARFLCTERPDWSRDAASGYPDWLSEGQWHIVSPCVGAAETGLTSP